MFQSPSFQVSSSDGHNFVLLQSCIYIAKDGTQYVMPAGATSDGASTPQEIWNLIPPFGKYWMSAFLHDCCYRNTLQVLAGDGVTVLKPQANLTEEQSNNLLLEAMDSQGVNVIERDIIYKAVCDFGKSSFDSDRGIK
jgi:hypothetical protein